MNREEILKKAQNNIQDFDERETQIIEKSMRISTIIVPILSIIFIFFRFFNPNKAIINIADLLTIIFAELFITNIYQFKELHKKVNLIISILSLIITLCFFIFYIFS